ncbi:plastocyanin [Floridanema aerugineum]|jgi:plastocyanin|uniref:Plastocyanin n=1 Tax=Floridaenema aerugineum BLCC-F46 TaxID=3153654 RepID=A0ABV4XFA7_9CYAN
MKFMSAIWRRMSLALLTMVLVASSFVVMASPASADTVTVKMGADNGMLSFQPAKVTIKPGDTVKWVNNKVPPHNVVFDTAKNPAKSAALAKTLSHKGLVMKPGDEVSVTFPANAAAGEYTYYCEPHRGAGMVGTIVVQ